VTGRMVADPEKEWAVFMAIADVQFFNKNFASIFTIFSAKYCNLVSQLNASPTII
jgi:hypothetical protein